MTNYYDDVINEIKNAIEEENFDEATYLLKKELSMPYIPQDIETQLMQFNRDLQYLRASNKKRQEDCLEDLLKGLNGREKKQLISAEKLMERNLRLCIPEIQAYLEKDPLPEAAALIVEAIAEQEINEDFVWVKNGLQYEFSGDAVIPVVRSEGYYMSSKELDDKLAKNPSLLDLAQKILIHKAMMLLPLSIEEEEVYQYANDSALEACELLQDLDSYNKIKECGSL